MSERTLPTVEELRANGCGGYTFDELVKLKSDWLDSQSDIQRIRSVEELHLVLHC